MAPVFNTNFNWHFLACCLSSYFHPRAVQHNFVAISLIFPYKIKGLCNNYLEGGVGRLEEGHRRK